jgi:hypothetical protein
MVVRRCRPGLEGRRPVDDQRDDRVAGDALNGAVGPDGVGAATVPVFTGISEEQLTELALAADPNEPVDEDAVPLSVYLGDLEEPGGLLPQWYMPTPMARSGSRWRLPVVLVIVAAFVIIEAAGLCSTFGQLVPH